MAFRILRLCFMAFLACMCAASSFADDQQKAEKQLRKITAMASDVTARGIVSSAVAGVLNVKRDQLVRERRAMNLNYGEVFLAHQLTARGTRMLDLAMQLSLQKNVYQIANDQHIDWKQVTEESKRVNKKIEDGIYRHFLHAKVDNERDVSEKYNAAMDWVKSDADITSGELREAQETYVMWRDRAGQVGGQGTRVTSSDELASQRIEERAHDMRIPPPASH